MVAVELAQRGYMIRSLFTFSSPRCMNVDYVHYAQGLLAKSTVYRFINGRDPTPNVPMPFFGFSHIGNPVYCPSPKTFCVRYRPKSQPMFPILRANQSHNTQRRAFLQQSFWGGVEDQAGQFVGGLVGYDDWQGAVSDFNDGNYLGALGHAALGTATIANLVVDPEGAIIGQAASQLGGDLAQGAIDQFDPSGGDSDGNSDGSDPCNPDGSNSGGSGSGGSGSGGSGSGGSGSGGSGDGSDGGPDGPDGPGAADPRPPGGGGGFGDPHFSTLDGLQYTFNGLGDYTYLQSSSFVSQIRLVQLGVSSASIISSVAAQQTIPGGTILVLCSAPDNSAMQLWANGALYPAFFSSNRSTVRFADVTVVLQDFRVTMLWNSGIQLSVDMLPNISSNLSALNVGVVVASDLFDTPFNGLMGNYDGNADNDLRLPNGTVLASSLASQEDAVLDFGVAWAVQNATSLSSNLLLWSSLSSSVDGYGNTGTNATGNFGITSASNATIAMAESMCGADKFCYYDLLASNNPALGESTRSQNVALAEQRSLATPPPMLVGTTEFTVTLGEPFAHVFTARSFDGAANIQPYQALPANASCDDGVFQWIPSAASMFVLNTGDYYIRLQLMAIDRSNRSSVTGVVLTTSAQAIVPTSAAPTPSTSLPATTACLCPPQLPCETTIVTSQVWQASTGVTTTSEQQATTSTAGPQTAPTTTAGPQTAPTTTAGLLTTTTAGPHATTTGGPQTTGPTTTAPRMSNSQTSLPSPTTKVSDQGIPPSGETGSISPSTSTASSVSVASATVQLNDVLIDSQRISAVLSSRLSPGCRACVTSSNTTAVVVSLCPGCTTEATATAQLQAAASDLNAFSVAMSSSGVNGAAPTSPQGAGPSPAWGITAGAAIGCLILGAVVGALTLFVILRAKTQKGTPGRKGDDTESEQLYGSVELEQAATRQISA